MDIPPPNLHALQTSVGQLNQGQSTKDLTPFVQRRCNQHDSGDWKGLTVDYNGDVVAAQLVHKNDDRAGSTKDEVKQHKVSDLLAHM